MPASERKPAFLPGVLMADDKASLICYTCLHLLPCHGGNESWPHRHEKKYYQLWMA